MSYLAPPPGGWDADYRAAQAAGHHVDCDGYRLAHRVNIVVEKTSSKVTPFLYHAVCEECGPLHIGSYETPDIPGVRGHSQEVACDLRCRDWDEAGR